MCLVLTYMKFNEFVFLWFPNSHFLSSFFVLVALHSLLFKEATLKPLELLHLNFLKVTQRKVE